jgi:hypothetical protein
MRPVYVALCLLAGCVNLTPPAGLDPVLADGATTDTLTSDVPAAETLPPEDASRRDAPSEGGPDLPPPDGGIDRSSADVPLGLDGPDPAPPDTAPVLSPAGADCVAPGACASGFCVDGVCCSSACTGQCAACNLPGLLGTCAPAPSGQDPQQECLAEPLSTCGRAGGCDGSGACRLHAAGTGCANTSCSVSTETSARTCNGAGVCQPATTRDCGAYLCGTGACRTSCGNTSECRSGFDCVSGVCSGPALHWRFDEASGTAALDASGNGFNGTYSGQVGRPTSSTSVPPLQFTNPTSRDFVGSQGHQVRLGSVPAALTPSNSVTASAWFRTSSVDSGGFSLIINVNEGYFIVLGQGELWQARGISASPRWVYCSPVVSGFTDNQWHHIAGVWSPTGMKLYLDGNLECENSEGGSIVYDASLGLVVGRRDDPLYPFDGNIDDVRIYTRVLSAARIQALADGAP